MSVAEGARVAVLSTDIMMPATSVTVPSVTVRDSEYIPATSNVAVVSSNEESPIVTIGPIAYRARVIARVRIRASEGAADV